MKIEKNENIGLFYEDQEKSMKLLFLGTGGSCGIPMIGCTCEVCQSKDPHNQRLRPSALLSIQGKILLIDATPDLRQQALRFNINRLDGVIITHTHYDHVGGLDELRSFYLLQHHAIPVLVSQSTQEELKKRVPYLFREKSTGKSLSAQLQFCVLEKKRGETVFIDIPIQYVTYEQGGMEVNGFRLNDFAYISDIRHYPDTLFEDLRGVRWLVLSALHQNASLMHFSFEEAIAFARRIGVEKTWFTHLSHKIDHAVASKELPPGFALAYDGLSLEF